VWGIVVRAVRRGPDRKKGELDRVEVTVALEPPLAVGDVLRAGDRVSVVQA
jgi:hypothetical protein